MKNLFIRLSSTSEINKIFLIDCLGGDDLQTGRKRYGELIDALAKRDVFCHSAEDDVEKSIVVRFKINSTIDMANKFKIIERCCKSNIHPLIIIDGHGDKEKGILLPNNTSYAWGELIASFRKVIELSHGELTVVAAFCYSMNLIKHLPPPYENGGDVYHKMPFSFYYGYDGKISAGKVADNTIILAERLFDDKGADFEHVNMSKYKEFDYVIQLLMPIIHGFLGMAPGGECVKKMKGLEFSKKHIVDLIEKKIVKNSPLSGVRKKTIKHINNGGIAKFIAYNILYNCMHDTNRRRELIESIEKYIDENLPEFMAIRKSL